MRFTPSVIQALACSSLLFLSLSGQTAVEAVPSNDFCINATTIAVGSTIEVNTTLATSTSDGDCFSEIDSPRLGVWYTFVGTGERIIVESCPSSSWIAIFSGGCSSSSRTCVARTSNTCGNERFHFDSVSGTKYHLLFQTYSEVLLTLSIFPAPVPNDACTGATPLSIGSTVSGNLTYATTEFNFTALDDCIDDGSSLSPGVWYTFVGTGERLVVRSCSYNYYYYANVAIYSGGCSSRTCVAATNKLCDRERYSFDTVAGTTYHVLIQSIVDTFGNFSIFAISPVSNDECTLATPITIGSTISVNTTYATTESNFTALDDCIDDGYPLFPGLWYTFIGTGEILVMRGCTNSFTYTTIFSGGCSSVSRTCVAATKNLCDRERYVLNTVAGTTYHVLIQTSSAVAFDFSIFVRPPVTNDVCANAALFTIGSSISVNTTYATKESNFTALDDCIDDGASLYPGLWYTFIGTGETLVARSCNYWWRAYMNVAIFSGGCDIGSRTCVAATSKLCDRERFMFDTVAGMTYHILVQSNGDDYLHDFSIFARPPVTNTACVDATQLTIGSNISVNTTYATKQTNLTALGDCIGDGNIGFPGLWYKFAGTGDKLHVRACSAVGRVNVLVFSGGCDIGLRTCVAASGSPCELEPVMINTINGTTYHVLVQSFIDTIVDFSVSPPIDPSTAPMATSRPTPSPIPKPEIRNGAIGIVFGDPHIVTMDGFGFDCQARGEFTMLKSIDDTSFHIQGRFTKASTSGFGIHASVTSGIVISESNSSSIQVSFESNDANTVRDCLNLIKVYVGGALKPLINGINYSNVTITVLNNEEIIIMYNSGLEVHLILRVSDSWGCFLTHWIALPGNYRPNEKLTGLLGNANGDRFDDWQSKLGVTLPTPNNDVALFQGGYDYCRIEWCLRNVTDSLFTYSQGESFAMYFECDAPYSAQLENAIKAAPQELVQVCGNYIECLIDGSSGTVVDAQKLLNETSMLLKVLIERNITYINNVTLAPSPNLTTAPSRKPSKAPSLKPTTTPSRKPSANVAPTLKPTAEPSRKPSTAPTRKPTTVPMPSRRPSKAPTLISTPAPTSKPCGIIRRSILCSFRTWIRFLRKILGI